LQWGGPASGGRAEADDDDLICANAGQLVALLDDGTACIPA
jgi:hypothetical protein